MRTGATWDSDLVSAAQGRRPRQTPVWFMRQAGRSLPEYREIRAQRSMLETCFDTELITEITLQPVRRHNVDAAIFFSDIVVPIKAIGVDVEIVPGVGPVIAEPFRQASDIARLRDLTEDDVAPVLAAVRALVGELGQTPLIGFAGAPFTLASYLVEGRPSRDHLRTKALMLSDPKTWHALLERLSVICGEFLRMQVLAGASAIQLFDSWVGAVSTLAYAELVAPHSAATFAAVNDLPVPRIHFGVGTGELIAAMHEVGATVMGVDYRLTLAQAMQRIGRPVPLQGNLDPAALFADWTTLTRQVDRVLAEAVDLPGHIFNLGHGVPPDTDPEVLTDLVAYVHERTRVVP